MEENKRIKGTYGYIDSLKRSKLVAIGIWAIFIALLLIIPSIIFKTRYNSFTHAAIVMVLPAARQVVQYLSLLPFHSGNREEYEKIRSLTEGKSWIVLAADMVLASESGHMMLDMLVIYNGNVYGYAPAQKKSREAIEAYLTNILTEEDLIHKKPVVHENFEEFEEMVMMLAANEPSAPVEAGAIFSRLKSNCL